MEQAQVLTFLNNKDRDLLLQFCGYSTTEPLHSFGPAVRPHYIIHFIKWKRYFSNSRKNISFRNRTRIFDRAR